MAPSPSLAISCPAWWVVLRDEPASLPSWRDESPAKMGTLARCA